VSGTFLIQTTQQRFLTPFLGKGITMAIRNDYNGFCVTHPNGLLPWYLIDKGRKRGITPTVYPHLQRAGRGVQTDIDVVGIDDGDVWPEDMMIIGYVESSARWLYENGKKRGIPSGQIYDDYGFPRGSGFEVMLPKDIVDHIPEHPAGNISPRTPTPQG
jgi:hypothetical protein